MSEASWSWRPGRAGYAAHLGHCSAWIQLETFAGPGGEPRAVAGATAAQRFRVALLGSGQVVERYWLRGSLAQVKAKLGAALERRHAAWQPMPDPPGALDWRRDGPWYAPFHERSPDAP